MKFDLMDNVAYEPVARSPVSTPDSLYMRYGKRVMDVVFSLLLLPPTIGFGLALLLVNPFLNRGSLFFVQPRMGQNCRAFPAIKFRTMRACTGVTRRADDPVEYDRITKLGRFLRKTRIDELPQIINVLRGEMSLIGPRPDAFSHARTYLRTIPGYRERHQVKPGISGLAQTSQGYVSSIEETKHKVSLDLYYIRHSGWRMDARVFLLTLQTVFLRKGR